VGFHGPDPATLDVNSSLKVNDEGSWYPTSREKRASYGAPVIR
jgi:hypothetical protein